MNDIIVADLLAWDERIRRDDPTGYYSTALTRDADLAREVTWAVSLRASMPVLPQIRGGEIVVMPDRILSEAGVGTEEIMQEVIARGATGVLVDGLINVPPPLVALWSETIPADLETDLNRLLTEQRGSIYQLGTELGSRLTSASSRGSHVEEVVQLAADLLGLQMAIVQYREGVVAASAGFDVAPDDRVDLSWPAQGWIDDVFVTRLSSGVFLWIGPVSAEKRALARIVADRVALAAEISLSHADNIKPRGNARAVALAGLLSETRLEASRNAATLGLPSNGIYQVVLGDPARDWRALQRNWIGGGTVHEVMELDGLPALLIEFPSGSAPRNTVVNSRMQRTQSRNTSNWTVRSACIAGTASIPLAASQARYMAALVQSGLLSSGDLQFDHPGDVGVFRLMFSLWGTGELTAYAQDTLGLLREGDRRGTLQETLLAFLDTGGSQVEAAKRLGVHRNTLAYRLKQIHRLTGTNPVRTEGRLTLHMALIASKLPPGAPAT